MQRMLPYMVTTIEANAESIAGHKLIPDIKYPALIKSGPLWGYGINIEKYNPMDDRENNNRDQKLPKHMMAGCIQTTSNDGN